MANSKKGHLKQEFKTQNWIIFRQEESGLERENQKTTKMRRFETGGWGGRTEKPNVGRMECEFQPQMRKIWENSTDNKCKLSFLDF